MLPPGRRKGSRLRKAFSGFRAMLNHAHAKDFVEKTFAAKRKLIDAGLKHMQPRFVCVNVCIGSVYRVAQIEGKNLRSSFKRKLGKAACAAACFQDALTTRDPRPSRAVIEALATQIVSHHRIELAA